MKKITTILLIISMLISLSACSGKDVDSNNPDQAKTPVNSTVENTQQTNGVETVGDLASEPPVGQDEELVETRYYTSSNGSYRTVYCSKSDFWFDLPQAWKAMSKTSDSDGFYIFTENDKIDVRVYGTIMKEEETEYYKTLAGEKGSVEEFIFDDGMVGSKISTGADVVYYVRPDGDSFIALYADFRKDQAWWHFKEVEFEKLAGTIRTVRDPQAQEMNSKISLEDLALGIYFIDMPYIEFMKYATAEVAAEQDDEAGGRIVVFKDDTEIYFFDDYLVSMNVIDSSYETPRGLKTGDSEEKVIELYGQPDRKTDDGVWGYDYEGYELLTVVISQGIVVQIQIDMTI